MIALWLLQFLAVLLGSVVYFDKTHFVDVDMALLFGTRRGRTLVWDLDAECYSFLDAIDLASFFWVSHAVSSAVIRFLRQCKDLHLYLWPKTRADIPQWLHMLGLTLKHCRNVQNIYRAPHNKDRWLAQLIKANRNTMRYVNDGVNARALEELLQCPNLEVLLSDQKGVSKTLMKMIERPLPKLKELILRNCKLSDDAIVKILSQGNPFVAVS